MISTEKYAYSKQYDVYVDRSTRVIYKRNSRRRKTEIQEEELVPVKLTYQYDRYIQCQVKDSKRKGIYHVFADAFPHLVKGADLHELDPETYCELDHINHVHDTYESNFPENLQWISPRVNRALTSRTKSLSEMDDKARERTIKHRESSYKRWFDPEKIEHNRKLDRERKRRYRESTKSLRKQESAELNEWVAKMDKPRLLALEVAKLAQEVEKN